ncbi:hypothetical protein C8R46DRAFT_1229406 [Mycena filopes]|nr:hypothetical protein C8R46DRAFT_1229406 [Mycena filopes]
MASTLRAQLLEDQSAILQHQKDPDPLQEKRREVETQLAAVASSPVLTLPFELVSQIFIECLPIHGRVRPKVDTPPLSLSQVCRPWREIALSTCELWSSLDLLFRPKPNPNGPTSDHSLKALPLLETWLSRAEGYPLSITIRSKFPAFDPQIMPLISNVAGQLRSLELTVEPQDFWLLAPTQVTFPRLRRFAVCAYEFDAMDNIVAPQLLELTLLGTLGSLHRYPLLNSLQLGRISYKQFMTLSRQCPRLLHLKVKRVVSDSIPSDSETIIFPRLESLDLSCQAWDLNSLTTPRLRRLDLHLMRMSYSNVVLPFLERSACALEHIGLRLNFIIEPDLKRCLEGVPSVGSLSIAVHRDGDIFKFAELMLTNLDLLPYLQTLVVFASLGKFDYVSFMSLVRARRDPRRTTRLESVQLNFFDNLLELASFPHSPWLPGSVRDEFGVLIADGLKLQVTWAGEGWPEPLDPCETFTGGLLED